MKSNASLKDSPLEGKSSMCVWFLNWCMGNKWLGLVREHQVPDSISSQVTSMGRRKVALEMQVGDAISSELWQKQYHENPPQAGVIKHFLILFAMLLPDRSLHRLDWRSKLKIQKKPPTSRDWLQITLSSSCILLHHVNTQTDSSLHGSQSDFAYSIIHLSATQALDSKWQLRNSALYYFFLFRSNCYISKRKVAPFD